MFVNEIQCGLESKIMAVSSGNGARISLQFSTSGVTLGV